MQGFPKLISICGRRRSGKDTIASFLCNEYGYANHKIADDLKSLVKLLFGFSDSQVETDTKDVVDPRWGISPRKALQFFGTEIMQYQVQHLLPDVGRNFWIQSFIKKNIIDTNKLIVISDMRFVHEYNHLKNHDVFVIRVERDDHELCEHDEHVSEKEYLNIPAHVIVKNNGNHEELYANIRAIFNQT
jgi:hypothetical protein